MGESIKRILIIGGVGGTNVGHSFFRAAKKMGSQVKILDTFRAYDGPFWQKKMNWYLLGRRPVHLNEFGAEVLLACREFQPEVMITTGLAPLSRNVMDEIGRLGVRRLNFLTDDPWNPAHRASWFIKALPSYDEIYSPRKAMIPDLFSAGCEKVHYLPFAYDPELFFPATEEEHTKAYFSVSDVVFAGAADQDRIPYMEALIQNNFNLSLYGEYWSRQPQTRLVAKGQADTGTLRLALSSAKIGLCLVRRANRDGNCMRTFEVPAVGTCMLTEDTPEHRKIFGEEGEAVLYFDTLDAMLAKARVLCDNDILRHRLAENAHKLITQGGHTYKDRLLYMLAGKSWGEDITS